MNTIVSSKTPTSPTKRWEVFNKRTDKTVKYVATRTLARAVKNSKATPSNYGIYDTVRDMIVR